jgi:hypothetical protein
VFVLTALTLLKNRFYFYDCVEVLLSHPYFCDHCSRFQLQTSSLLGLLSL